MLITINDKIEISSTHFTWLELSHSVVPDELRYNIIPTVVLLEKIREYVNCPININSGYRTPEYNKKIGGAPHSLHIQFKALDFSVQHYKIDDYKNLAKLISEGGFGKAGGVGTYSSWIHIDCGERRNW